MSGQDISLLVAERTVEGKAVKGLRKTGIIPAVIHDHGQESKIIQAPYSDIWKAYQQAGKHHPVTLSLGSKKIMTIIKDIDIDPKSMNYDTSFSTQSKWTKKLRQKCLCI